MRFLAATLTIVSVTVARAAVVQGVVLDEETGNPLARTLVTLSPLPGTSASPVILRSGERGAFSILSVRPGWYVLKTSRRGYADAEVGQMRPGRPGMPFEVANDNVSSFLQVRMRHLAAMTGSVLDDNNVGIPEWPVNVYTASKPVRRIADGKTDERGNFRIGGLDPGVYVVRTSAGYLEDDSPLLPAYFKYGTALETAEAVRLRLGETVPDIVVRPGKGRLLQLSGTFSSTTAAHLTLITDTGRKPLAALGLMGGSVPFDITGIPPGPVEFVAEGDIPDKECGSYTRMIADKDTPQIRIGCGQLYKPTVDWQNARDAEGTPIMARRVDLDGTGPAKTLRTDQPLPPGHWELTLQPPAQYYLSNIRASFGGEAASRNDGWFGLYLGNQTRLQVVLATRPANISGVVSAGGSPVAGALIYLEMFDPNLPEKRLQLWTGRSDALGNYKFAQLAPGRYRLLSSFDMDPDDPLAMDRAAEVTVTAGMAAIKALEMLLP